MLSKNRKLTIAYVIVAAALATVIVAAYMFAKPRLDEIQRTAHRLLSDGRLSQLELLLHNYHDEHNKFPPKQYSQTGASPRHSWRVLLVKYMDDEELHLHYSFDKTWNSEANLKLARDNIETVGSFQGGFHKSQNSLFTDFFAGETTQADEYSNRGWKTRLVEKEGDKFLLVEVSNSEVHWLTPVSELDGATLY